MSLDYEPLDLSYLETESARVNAAPNANNQEDYLAKFVKLPDREGYVSLRLLPKQKGQPFFASTRTHRLGGKNGRNVHCPKTLVMTDKGPRWQGDCVICRYYSDLWKRSEAEGLSEQAVKDLQDKAREIKPNERYYYNAIVRQETNKDGKVETNVGPKIFSCGKTVHAKICRAIVGDKTAGEKPLGDITHPETGRDFRLVKKTVKSGANEWANYDTSKFDDPCPLGTPEEMKTWMDSLHNLNELRKVKTDEELTHELKMHLGLVKSTQTDEVSFDSPEWKNPSENVSISGEVREDLVTRKEVESKPAEEIMVDDDFIKELGDM